MSARSLCLLLVTVAACTEPPPPASRRDALSPPARAPRRLSAAQLHAAIEGATGEVWRGPATIVDPLSYTGTRDAPDADLLKLYAAGLGAPDFNYTVQESLEPTITFAKYAEDAVRATCTAAARKTPSTLVKVSGDDEAARRANATALVLRFWGDVIEPSSDEVNGLLELHGQGGWAAVCVALATHPRFLTF
ncbi:MAG: hypothetical protein SFW67_17890 [Myxococcaceae bacterium]|nr:hypothetical protein [Myxococcaceae bacterium]